MQKKPTVRSLITTATQHTPGPGVAPQSPPGVNAASPLPPSSKPAMGVPSKLPPLLPAAAGLGCGLGVAKSCVRSAPPSKRSNGGGPKPCCCSCWRCALRSSAPATPPCRSPACMQNQAKGCVWAASVESAGSIVRASSDAGMCRMTHGLLHWSGHFVMRNNPAGAKRQQTQTHEQICPPAPSCAWCP
jgi:hypothetical protein